MTAVGRPENAATTLTEIVSAVDDRTPQGIAATVSRLVGTGRLETGVRLPTVRELAGALGTSPTTVNAAWQALAARGVIESRGRLGTFVLARSHRTQRYSRMSGDRPRNFRLDLATGIPDPALLPDLGPALLRIGRRAHVSNYHEAHVVPELRDRALTSWPYPPDSLAVVDGALDALDRLITSVVGFGDRVLVENPTFPAMLDLLDQRGAQPVPVAIDEHGPVPGSVAEALRAEPVAFLLQPRAHNPTGASLTARRVRELARVLRDTGVLVIEDDHAGDIATTPDLSLGALLPAQTVHIRSYSKSHGPDLRIAVVAGPAALIDPLTRRRHLGSGWSSRLLQNLLVELLDDPTAHATVSYARQAYDQRRQALRSALAERGVTSSAGSGVNLWVEVHDEQSALITLAAAGIRASPGGPFLAAPLPQQHIRLTSGLLGDDAAEIVEIADHVAAAAAPAGSAGASRAAQSTRRQLHDGTAVAR